MIKLLSLAVGGVVGTVARYGLAVFVHRLFGSHFAYGTLAVNLAGCFILGWFVAFADHRAHLPQELKLFLTVGFCGAFTTFSTFILETSGFLRQGDWWKALLYVLASVTVGFLVFRAGLWLGEIL